jgi:cytochrome P450
MTCQAASTRERARRQLWSNRRARNAWRRLIDAISSALRTLKYRVVAYLISHPLPLRIGYGVLRRLRPISVIGPIARLAKAADVVDVLARFDDFTITEHLGPKMPWGQFLLNLDGREQHARERQMLESVVNRSNDSERLKALVDDALKPMRASGRREVDVVKDMCEPVVWAIANQYYGVPMMRHDGAEMMRLMSALGSNVILEPPERSERRNEMRDSIDEFTKRLDDAIHTMTSAAKAGPLPGDDILSRLVRDLAAGTSGIDHSFVRRYVTGLVTAGTATVVRAATHAVDQLLARPAPLKSAQQLAAELTHAMRAAADPAKSSEESQAAKQRVDALRLQLLQVAYEALRFRPMLPLMSRYCPRAALVGKGTSHARMIGAGKHVITPPIAANFDPERFERPSSFRIGRPLDDYLHFGVGTRKCFGQYVADVAIIAIVHEVLCLKGVERALGSRGRVVHDGPVARSLVVTFDP